MLKLSATLGAFLFLISGSPAGAAGSFFDLSTKTIQGKDYPLAQHKGQVVVVVNTASQCGYTPQLGALQDLYTKNKKRGLAVLAFPSGDFNQELGQNKEIEAFAKKEFAVTFPLMDKASVRGPQKQPIFQFLTAADAQKNPLTSEVSWNFEKFIVSKKGDVVARFKSNISPNDPEFIKAVEAELKK